MEENETLRKIAAERKVLATSFDAGDITGTEYETELSALFEQERGAGREIDRIAFESSLRHIHPPHRLGLYLLAAFGVGFFISPHVYPRVFGYRYAEQCILDHHSTNVAASACINLYPTAPSRQTPSAVDQPSRE